MPQLYSLLNQTNPTIGLQGILVELFDDLLASGKLTGVQAFEIARMRARCFVFMDTME